MKVLMKSDNTLVDCNDAYGERLIEQGMAVLPKPEMKETEKPKEEAPAKPEKPRKGDQK